MTSLRKLTGPSVRGRCQDGQRSEAGEAASGGVHEESRGGVGRTDSILRGAGGGCNDSRMY